MKNLAKSTLAPVLVVVALAALQAVPAVATSGQHDKGLPYRATYVISASGMEMAPGYPDEKSHFDGRCSVPSDWVIAFVGSGNATHLGTLAFSSSHCTQMGEVITISDGQAELVAASGDVLLYEYGNARFSFPDEATACALIDATFVGGTGRFAGATGDAEESSCFELTGGPMVVDMRIDAVGAVAYDASGNGQ
jgi:hypothetical protein